METILANVTTAKTRRVFHDGRYWLVAPATIIVPGVLNGSQGPLYYPPDEIGKNHSSWEGIPLTAYHPYDPITNAHLSAGDDGVLDRQGIGIFRNPTANGKLGGEAWFDEERTKAVDRRIYNALIKHKPLELSTGLFTDNVPQKGTHNGRPYDAVARNYRPDHVAVLPDQIGACSVADGCGVLVNQAVGQAKKPTLLSQFLSVMASLVGNKGQPSDDISPDKACQILHDGTAQGHPLTEQQRKMFGARCGNKTRNAAVENVWSDAARKAAALARGKGDESPEDLKSAIHSHLADNPQTPISDLRRQFGGKAKFNPHKPLDHPVHAALVDLRDEGKIEAHESQWGEPRFSTKKTTNAQGRHPSTGQYQGAPHVAAKKGADFGDSTAPAQLEGTQKAPDGREVAPLIREEDDGDGDIDDLADTEPDDHQNPGDLEEIARKVGIKNVANVDAELDGLSLKPVSDYARLMSDRAKQRTLKVEDDETSEKAAKAHEDAAKAHKKAAEKARSKGPHGGELDSGAGDYHEAMANYHLDKAEQNHIRAGKGDGEYRLLTSNAWSEAARQAALEARHAVSKSADAIRAGGGNNRMTEKVHDLSTEAAEHAEKGNLHEASEKHLDAAMEHRGLANYARSVGNEGMAKAHEEAASAHYEAYKNTKAAANKALTEYGSKEGVQPTKGRKRVTNMWSDEARRAASEARRASATAHDHTTEAAEGDSSPTGKAAANDALKHSKQAYTESRMASTHGANGDEDLAEKSHMAAQQSHMLAAKMLNKSGDPNAQAAAQAHIMAAHAHGRAFHQVNNAEAEGGEGGGKDEGGFDSDAQRRAFFGKILKEGGGETGKQAAVASKMANEKSASAKKGSRASGHNKAAELHTMAAKLHFKAAKASTDKALKEGHAKAASEHNAQAKWHTEKAKTATRNQEMGLRKNLTAFIENCQCDETKAALQNLLSNTEDESGGATLDDGWEAGREGSGKTADDYDDDDDEYADKVKGQIRSKKAVGNSRSITERLTPQELEVWNSAVEINRREKLTLVRRLVANVSDPKRRKAIGDGLMKKPIGELKQMVELLPPPSYGNGPLANLDSIAADSNGVPIYRGAGGGAQDIGLTANATETTEDWPPTLNYKELVEEQRGQAV